MRIHVPVVICGLLLSWSAVASAAEEPTTGAVETSMDYFVFIYRPGPGWSGETPPLEQPGVEGHFLLMGELEESKILVTGGPFKDFSGLFGIIEAESLSQARNIIARDPILIQGTMVADILPWHPTVTGCIEPRRWTPGS